MKLIDALKLGFSLRRYNGEIVYSGTGVIDENEGVIIFGIHKGFESDSHKPIRDHVKLPLSLDVNPQTMELAITVRFNEEIANSLALLDIAPITRADIIKVRGPRKEESKL